MKKNKTGQEIEVVGGVITVYFSSVHFDVISDWQIGNSSTASIIYEKLL